ncbi:MAG: hypothetical protein JWR51_4657 [Devosia sp.]|uniref:hypothetical protein n=1 Tax=Devosia sp. TaxID=1871048 RepID=UPI00260760C3|nr:hypothetical protein [Devosia sp.]MDB5531554.1 hypothetical protein [Devosia sp.]
MSGLSDDAIRAYAANIFDLEDERETAQTDLKDAWSHIREAHGKKFADSLKLAVKRSRQDADKRAAADEVDAEAERIMAVLSAPRARRTRENIEQFGNSSPHSSIPEHDADGVIIESETNHGGEHGRSAITEPNSSTVAAADVPAAVIENDDMAAGAGSSAGGSSDVPASDVERVAPHSEPEAAMLPQTVTATMPVAIASAGQASVESPATKPDLSKPNPWCVDPDDCGVEASWNHMCSTCMRRRDAQRHQAEAVH